MQTILSNMTDIKKPLSHVVSSKLRFPIFTHVVMAFPEVFTAHSLPHQFTVILLGSESGKCWCDFPENLSWVSFTHAPFPGQ